jgi:mercuric ion binding protein
MKTIKVLFVIVFAVSITAVAKAQNYKLDGPFLATKTIKANGSCEMCKHRIENALKKSSAIKTAVWNENSKTVQVQYFKSKINPSEIEQLIAAVGHDTEKFKAIDDVYGKLPDCCHYQRTN